MQQRFFSIIVVSLNPGERLKQTLDSIRSQTFTDYEVIIKDGCSTDGAIEKLRQDGYFTEWEGETDSNADVVEENSPSTMVRILVKKDSGIYDGMNQALEEIHGQYVQFLNCGDRFYNEQVLVQVHRFMEEHMKPQNDISSSDLATREIFSSLPYIFYGNQYNLVQQCEVTSAPQMNDFACFRNVPCHQVCFYDRELFSHRGYLPKYSVRADYEHFLYSIYECKAVAVAMPYIICFYEGGGYSETAENRKCSAAQHKEITAKYMGKKVYRYRLIMLLTLAPLRTKLAESKHFSAAYNLIKSFFYHG